MRILKETVHLWWKPNRQVLNGFLMKAKQNKQKPRCLHWEMKAIRRHLLRWEEERKAYQAKGMHGQILCEANIKDCLNWRISLSYQWPVIMSVRNCLECWLMWRNQGSVAAVFLWRWAWAVEESQISRRQRVSQQAEFHHSFWLCPASDFSHWHTVTWNC